jgi:hypothetical protein
MALFLEIRPVTWGGMILKRMSSLPLLLLLDPGNGYLLNRKQN